MSPRAEETITPGAEPEEIELKLAVQDRAAILALLRDPTAPMPGARWVSAARSLELEDRYLDTPEGELRAAGIVARIRTGGGRPRLTVKSVARRGVGAVHRRLELEADASDLDDPTTWPDSDAKARITAAIGALVPVRLVTIRQRRLQRDLAFGTSVIELSLDDMEVTAPDGRLEAWIDLEAELRTGSEDDLDALGRALLRRGDLAPARSSKLERAMKAVGPA